MAITLDVQDLDWCDFNLPVSQASAWCSVSEPHNVELWMDNYKVAGPVLLTTGSTYAFQFGVPNDGRTHQVWLKDPGTGSTNPYETSKVSVSSSCTGSPRAEVYNTNLNAVDIRVWVTGSGSYTCRVTLDGQTVGGEFQVTSASEVTRRVLVPPNGVYHLIKVEVRSGSQWATDKPILWFAMSTTQGGGDPGDEPAPTEPATEFRPGETIIVQSTEGSSPLATDGSEWVLVEISERGLDNWRPVGPDAGLVQPDEDGGWMFAIETNATDFPVGSQWDLRARRFRNYQPSLPVIKQFDMVSGTPGSVTLTRPVITGPYWDQRVGTWAELKGRGTPGAVLEFQCRVSSETFWGSPEQPPKNVTVPANGRWTAYAYATHSSYGDAPNFKVIEYRCRARFHGQVSDWSNWHEVLWLAPIR